MHSTDSLAKPERLEWIPFDRTINPPSGLTDFQQAWFWNLLRASFFDQVEMQGYLPITSNLWSIAGAKRSDFFDSHKSRLLACFEVRKVGGKEVLYFPPLVESMRRQWKRLRSRKGFSSEFSTYPQPSTERSGASTSPSQPAFDFDSSSKDQIQKQKPKSSSTRAREAVNGYTQGDFDARDLRKMCKAYEEAERMFQAQPGLQMTSKEIFEFVCQRAGITVARGLELEGIQKKWPESERPQTKAATSGE